MLRRLWLIAITALVVIALDALAKWWALSALQMGESLPFVPGFLQFTLTKNTGVAFGMGRGSGPLLAVLPIVVVLVLGYVVWKRERSGELLSALEQIGYGLVFGGALGNIGDRLLHGMVTDFLEFTFIQFPVFNVADALIDVGIGLLIIASLVPSTRKQADVNG